MRALNSRSSMFCMGVAAGVVMFADSAGACVCAGLPVCQVTDAALRTRPSPVFVGVVTEANGRSSRFRVQQMFEGVYVAELTLHAEGSDCDLRFTVGAPYLVYAYREAQTGELTTSMCSRTKRLGDPQSAADLAYLKARAAGHATTGWLGGVVAAQDYERAPDAVARNQGWGSRPLPDVRVTATSPSGESRSTVTDRSGGYHFVGITAGPWRVEADLPAPFLPHDGMVAAAGFPSHSTVLWLNGASCAEAHITARVAGSRRDRSLSDRTVRP